MIPICDDSENSNSKFVSREHHENPSINAYTASTTEKMGKPKSIQLSKTNMINGFLPNKKKVLVLVDSGCSKTLVSMSTIQNSDYLSKLQLKSVAQVTVEIANGDYMVIRKTITFNITIQDQVFEITGLVVPSLGSVDVLWGINELQKANECLDFSTNIFRFKCKTILLKTTVDVIVLPKQSKEIELIGKLPACMRNGDVIVRSNKLLSKIAPSIMLTRLHKCRIKIKVSNQGTNSVKIFKCKPLGTLDLELSTQHITPVTHIERTPTDTILYANRSDMKVEYVHDTNRDWDREKAFRATDNSKVSHISLYYEKREIYPFLEPNDVRLRMKDNEIIDRDIDMSTSVLSETEKLRFKQILVKEKQTLSLHGESGDCPHFQVNFELKDTTPFYIRPYKASLEDKEQIDKSLDKLVKLNVLRKGLTNYSSPLMLLNKRNSKEKRQVVDFRHLNSKIRKKNQSFPLIRRI